MPSPMMRAASPKQSRRRSIMSAYWRSRCLGSPRAGGMRCSSTRAPPAGRSGAGGPTFRAALGTIAKWTQLASRSPNSDHRSLSAGGLRGLILLQAQPIGSPRGRALAVVGGLRHIQDHTGSTAKERCVQVLVRDNNVDQALKALKKKMQREGIFREMKLRGHYEKPSEKKARERAEAIRRARKLARKKMQREGLLPGKPKPVMGGPGGPGCAPRRPSF